jgi:hypothetical protein
MVEVCWLICGQQSCMIPSRCLPQARENGGTTGQTEVEWEEALLMAWGLGRRDTAAPSGLLSAASRSSPAGRGRGDNPGREGAAAR